MRPKEERAKERFLVRITVNVEVMAESLPVALAENALAFAELIAGQALVQGTANEAQLMPGKVSVRRAKPTPKGGGR